MTLDTLQRIRTELLAAVSLNETTAKLFEIGKLDVEAGRKAAVVNGHKERARSCSTLIGEIDAEVALQTKPKGGNTTEGIANP